MNLLRRIYRKIFKRKQKELTPTEVAKINGVNVGENYRITGPVFYSSEPYLITIGDDVLISANVNFITHDGGVKVINSLKNTKYETFGKIKVGNNVFIGMNSMILKGVTIGDNVIIGAGSIVTKDIPSNSVACGVPCRVIRTIDEWYEKNHENFVETRLMSPEEKKEFLLKYYKNKEKNKKSSKK